MFGSTERTFSYRMGMPVMTSPSTAMAIAIRTPQTRRSVRPLSGESGPRLAWLPRLSLQTFSRAPDVSSDRYFRRRGVVVTRKRTPGCFKVSCHASPR